MTLMTVLLLSVGTWGQRLLGMFVGGRLVQGRPALARLATLIPAAVVMAVIVQLTLANGTSLVVDERALGMAAAGLLVWRRAPFVAVVITAAAVTAVARMLS